MAGGRETSQCRSMRLYVPVQAKTQSCGVGGFINGDASQMAGCMLKTEHLFLIAEKVCSHRQTEDEIHTGL